MQMDYSQAMAFLDRYTNYERAMRYPYDGWAMNMERVRVLLDAAGRPEASLKIIHIAGTKGKGSTAAMLESCLLSAGYSTGMYSSPHLLDMRERIRINGEMVEPELVAECMPALIAAAEQVEKRDDLGELTYFEMLTALAISCFSRAGCETVLLEAGLGGRYDATNVCDPLVTVMTPISYDHMDILGDTLTEITIEKSMIIKPGKPAVIAAQPAEALDVLMQRCNDVDVEPVLVSERYTWKVESQEIGKMVFGLHGPRNLEGLELPFPGEHQALNAATAVTVLDTLSASGFKVSDQAIREGLSKIVWPGRFQRVRQSPDIILDGAHNAASAAYLRGTLEKTAPSRRVIAVIGLGGDKDVEGFFKELGPALSVVIITRSAAVKAVDRERMHAALAKFSLEIIDTDSTDRAMQVAMDAAGVEDVILVSGSFYVVGEALAWLEKS